MPLPRYFLFVGGVLLALLIVVDALLPKLPVAETANASLSVIRIHTDQKWPERIVFDTSIPPIIPAQIDNADVGAPANAQVREAFAQMRRPDAQPLQQSEPKKLKPEPLRKQKVAKRRAGKVLLARHPQFGWFGNSIW
jgi:hypothetical protein